MYQLSWYSTSSLGDGDQGDNDHGDKDKDGIDQLIDKLGEEEEQEEKEKAEDSRELDEDEKDSDRLDLGFLSKSHAITPITVPEFFPDVPVLTLSRNPLFPRFVKMLEVNHKTPLDYFCIVQLHGVHHKGNVVRWPSKGVCQGARKCRNFFVCVCVYVVEPQLVYYYLWNDKVFHEKIMLRC